MIVDKRTAPRSGYFVPVIDGPPDFATGPFSDLRRFGPRMPERPAVQQAVAGSSVIVR